MKTKLISIIVPCYNVETYLDKCVDSLLNQTYSNIEIILVDDGSSDRTPVICDNWSKKDNRIKVIHKENGGLVSARNAGYKAVTGEWHMYVDGDDWIDQNACEILAKKIEQCPNVDIIFWKFLQYVNDKPIIGKLEWKCSKDEQLYSKDECRNLAMNCFIYKSGIASPVIRLIRTSYAREYNIYHDIRLKQGLEGLELAFKSFYYAGSALYINKYLYMYRYNPNSISKKVDEKNTNYIIDCFKVIKEKIDILPEKEKYLPYFYQRIVYALIAIAMSTYFHPRNKDSLYLKTKKYSDVINKNQIFKDSLVKSNTKGIDKLRRIAFFFIKHRMYFMLHYISVVKQYMLKKGSFNY